MADQLLEGKVAIVTGAGSPIGIGHAITVALVRAGAKVAMMDINREWLDESVNEAREIGGDDCAAPILADVTDAEAVEAAVKQTIAELGGLHILVNNAGTNPSAAGLVPEGQGNPTRFWDVSVAAWTRVITVNVSGPVPDGAGGGRPHDGAGVGPHHRGDDEHGYDVAQRAVRAVQGQPRGVRGGHSAGPGRDRRDGQRSGAGRRDQHELQRTEPREADGRDAAGAGDHAGAGRLAGVGGIERGQRPAIRRPLLGRVCVACGAPGEG